MAVLTFAPLSIAQPPTTHPPGTIYLRMIPLPPPFQSWQTSALATKLPRRHNLGWHLHCFFDHHFLASSGIMTIPRIVSQLAKHVGPAAWKPRAAGGLRASCRCISLCLDHKRYDNRGVEGTKHFVGTWVQHSHQGYEHALTAFGEFTPDDQLPCLSINLSSLSDIYWLCLPTCLSVCLFVCLSISLSLSFCRPVCLFVCLSISSSVCFFYFSHSACSL